MGHTKAKVKDLKPNPNNPRVIRDYKFKKLKKRLQERPQYLNAKPIVVNSDMMVLGGNMRLRALLELGVEEVPVYIASDWKEDAQEEFIIVDNLAYGEWDWDLLANTWDEDSLGNWGMDIPKWGESDAQEVNKGQENDEWVGMPEFEAVQDGFKLVIRFESEEEREEFVEKRKLQIGVKATRTWSTHYPYKERRDLQSDKFE